MSCVPDSRPPPWAHRDLPRASLRLTRGGHSATRVGPSYWLRGRPMSQRERAFATTGIWAGKRGNLDTGLDHVNL